MSENILNTIIKLRRDYDYNYRLVGDTWKPANGEPVLVDTSRDGLRVKIGDGTKTFNELTFVDNVLIHGYYFNDKFYTDSSYTVECIKSTKYIYVNCNSAGKGTLYTWDGTKYNVGICNASDSIPGIMKLYGSKGPNLDGTMTQKAITDNLNTKFEVNVEGDETIAFTITL